MKEGWMKNDEGWKMKDEGWWFQAVVGFCRRTNEQTDGQTFVIVESLSWLKSEWLNIAVYMLLHSKIL